MARRILESFELHKIAAVDRPCQAGAVVTIMKRAADPDAADAVVKAADKRIEQLRKRMLVAKSGLAIVGAINVEKAAGPPPTNQEKIEKFWTDAARQASIEARRKAKLHRAQAKELSNQYADGLVDDRSKQKLHEQAAALYDKASHHFARSAMHGHAAEMGTLVGLGVGGAAVSGATIAAHAGMVHPAAIGVVPVALGAALTAHEGYRMGAGLIRHLRGKFAQHRATRLELQHNLLVKSLRAQLQKLGPEEAEDFIRIHKEWSDEAREKAKEAKEGRGGAKKKPETTPFGIPSGLRDQKGGEDSLREAIKSPKALVEHLRSGSSDEGDSDNPKPSKLSVPSKPKKTKSGIHKWSDASRRAAEEARRTGTHTSPEESAAERRRKEKDWGLPDQGGKAFSNWLAHAEGGGNIEDRRGESESDAGGGGEIKTWRLPVPTSWGDSDNPKPHRPSDSVPNPNKSNRKSKGNKLRVKKAKGGGGFRSARSGSGFKRGGGFRSIGRVGGRRGAGRASSGRVRRERIITSVPTLKPAAPIATPVKKAWTDAARAAARAALQALRGPSVKDKERADFHRSMAANERDHSRASVYGSDHKHFHTMAAASHDKAAEAFEGGDQAAGFKHATEASTHSIRAWSLRRAIRQGSDKEAFAIRRAHLQVVKQWIGDIRDLRKAYSSIDRGRRRGVQPSAAEGHQARKTDQVAGGERKLMLAHYGIRKIVKAKAGGGGGGGGGGRGLRGMQQVSTHGTQIVRRDKRISRHSMRKIVKRLPAGAGASDYIHDFINSSNPKFAGKSKQDRIRMALGAYYSNR